MFDFYWYTLEKYKKKPARWVLMVCNISIVHTNSNMPSIKNMYIYIYNCFEAEIPINSKYKNCFYEKIVLPTRMCKSEAYQMTYLVKFTANINIPQSSYGNLKAKFYNYYSVLHIISCLWSYPLSTLSPFLIRDSVNLFFIASGCVYFLCGLQEFFSGRKQRCSDVFMSSIFLETKVFNLH